VQNCRRRFDEADLLIIYIDGKYFGGHQVVSAVGVDSQGEKHILGITEGATENTVVVKGLLEALVERAAKSLGPILSGPGPRPFGRRGRRRLFVIDGSKALRKAIDEVYGADNPVQRCQAHKLATCSAICPRSCKGRWRR
jgi:transposase-like protein